MIYFYEVKQNQFMGNFLSQVSSVFSFGSGKKSDSFLGIDIGSSSVKVIQLKKSRGRVILQTYGELSIGPYGGLAIGQATVVSAEKTADLIKDLFREANVTASAGAFSIPLKSSLLVTIDLPEMGDKELKQAVPIEARKYIPVPISEVMLDWWPAPRRQNDGSQKAASSGPQMIDIVLAAIHKDTVNRYQSISKLTNITTDFFEIETFSAMRSSMVSDLAATVVVDMGAATTKVVIVDYATVRQNHTINKGAQDVTLAISRSLGVPFAKAEEVKRQVGLTDQEGFNGLGKTVSPVVEHIFSEVTKVMVDYQKKNNRSIERILLIGGGALLKGIDIVAKDNLYVPTEMGRPFSKVEAPAFLEPILAEVGPSFAVSIGLALRGLQDN
jgi:type IV pilus assembly protein PilM